METAIQVKKITFDYDRRAKRPVLENASLSVRRGTLAAVVGPNGSGKSTLLKIVAGLLLPQKGMVAVEGKPLHQHSPRRLARKLAYVPQDYHLGAPFTVRELVLSGRHPHLGPFGFERQADHRIAAEALAHMELTALAERPFQQLSGGEQQRTLVAAALAQQAAILVLDEPTASLDLGHQHKLMVLLQQLSREKNITVLAALHDLNLAVAGFAEIALLAERTVWATGTPTEVCNEENLARLYGASAFELVREPRLAVLPRRPAGPLPARSENTHATKLSTNTRAMEPTDD